ncbi:MAG: cation:proton antiporter, partial [Chloroflexi bacterium]|nr:cation:proton antiporter [Chloroflexota bacterium]
MPTLPELTIALAPELRFILDLGVAVALALVGGAVAVRLGQPPLVGYLAAGVIIGPFTPGFVGDAQQIGELAELGVVLLLFALGVEFSLRELARVRRVVVPGALAQILITAVAGAAVALPLGLGLTEAAVIGSAIAISSTLVVLKMLTERGELDSLHGRTAIGWMIMQDLVTILLIAMLEPLAGADLVGPVLFAILRTAAFLALAYLVGARLLPWLLRTVSRLGSPELFLLTVFATALLAAFLSSAVFGLSLALGAFVAGIIVSESDLSHQAASEITPFRDLFAVLFFVSVGMLLDPAAVLDDWAALLALLGVAMLVKATLGAVLGRLLRMPLRSAILLGATIGQVGEFSFLLVEQAFSLG